jgi:hypothetical protein
MFASRDFNLGHAGFCVEDLQTWKLPLMVCSRVHSGLPLAEPKLTLARS